MAFSAVQIPTTAGQVGAATTVNKAFAVNPTLANLLVAIFLWYDGTNNGAGTLTIKDANNNSFTISPNSPSLSRSGGGVYLGYLPSAPANADKTITATWTTVSVVASLWVMEFGVSGGVAGFSSDIKGTGTTGTALNTPTITVPGANTLLIAGASSDHQVSSVDSPWVQVAAGVANQFSEGIGYILAASANTALAMTQNQSSGWDSLGAAFVITAPPPASVIERPRGSQRPFPFLPGGEFVRRN